MKRTFFLMVLAALVLCGCAGEEAETPEGQSALVWDTSLAAARVKAEESGDLIMLSFGAAWCPWSRLIRESLFIDQAVVNALAGVRCVAIEADRESSLVREYGVTLFPTTVMADAYGSEIGRMVGYQTPDQFLERLAYIKRREDVLVDMFRREETSADDPIFLLAFGKVLTEVGMYDAALIRFDRASQIDKDDSYGALEEATFSLAETYMLAGEYKEAGRRFRLFAEADADGMRSELATLLAALCYEKVEYYRVATEIYEDYLETFPDGEYTRFVESALDSLEARRQRAG
jgi:tetratricopeptide (TPR) repeat protein